MVVFTACVVSGVAASNPAATVLWRSVVACFVAWIIGGLVGAVCERAMQSHIEAYKSDHPVPRSIDDLETGDTANDTEQSSQHTEGTVAPRPAA